MIFRTIFGMNTPAILVLEDGSHFQGISIGASGSSVGEVVFNTAMTGYQEILTDPSYAGQIVTLTYPHIGNVGTNNNDRESNRAWVAGLVIRDLSLTVSNWRANLPLSEYLKQQNIVGIAEIDTRRLTRILRNQGVMHGCIMAGPDVDIPAALEQARAFKGLKGADLAQQVSVTQSYEWNQGTLKLNQPSTQPTLKYNVVVYDYGVKQNILRLLVDHGCRLTVVPAKTPAKDIMAMNPDGIILANGPGDPAACDYAITAAKHFLEANIPLFGICLGHQLLALASGAKTIKMKFGHHGANHPVQDLETGQVLITSQNHGFAVDETSMPATLKPTHRSLFDGSLQGIERTDKLAFAFQGHPEASPGPHDVNPLFVRFIKMMGAAKNSSVKGKI